MGLKMSKEEFVERYKEDMRIKKLVEREMKYNQRSKYMNNTLDKHTYELEYQELVHKYRKGDN